MAKGGRSISSAIDVSPSSLLDWEERTDESPRLWRLDLKLETFPLESEAHFERVKLALEHFSEKLWRESDFGIEIYRGSLRFPIQWNAHHKAEASGDLLEYRATVVADFLLRCAASLPLDAAISAHLDLDGLPISVAGHLMSPKYFNHIELFAEGYPSHEHPLAVCLPPKPDSRVDELVNKFPVRLIPEEALTEWWQGVDQLIVFPDLLTRQGFRKVQGFAVTEGEILRYAEGALFPIKIEELQELL